MSQAEIHPWSARPIVKSPRQCSFLIRLCIALVLPILFVGCRGEDNDTHRVVLYSSIDATYTRQVTRHFENTTDIRVDVVSDTEAAKSTGLISRLIAEQDRPVADVFWSGDPVRSMSLVRKDIGRIFEVDGKFETASRLRMIIYNREHLKGRKIPHKTTDLALPEFASRACIGNPLFGTTSMHAAALFDLLGEDQAKQFFENFSANGGRMLASNGEVRRRVASGEFLYGLTDSDDVSVALTDGKPVGFLVPDQDSNGLGAIAIPTTAVLINGGPNSDSAEKLARFLVSADTESILALSDAAHFPSAADVPLPEVFESIDLEKLKIAELNYERLSSKLENLHESFLKRWVARQAR